MPFYKKKQTTFKTTKLDAFVVTIVIIVFLWAFFFDSFRPIADEDGDIITYITPDGTVEPVRSINFQVVLGPMILVYEMIVLVLLDGKTRGRYLPWDLYYAMFCYKVRCKLKEGINEYREWKKH